MITDYRKQFPSSKLLVKNKTCHVYKLFLTGPKRQALGVTSPSSTRLFFKFSIKIENAVNEMSYLFHPTVSMVNHSVADKQIHVHLSQPYCPPFEFHLL